jgi:hypothetical protein
MTSFFKTKSTFFIVGIIVIAIFAIAYSWLKRQHHPKEAVDVAQQFVTLLYQDKFESAYALTIKNGYTGKTLTEFQANAKTERCSSEPKYDYTFPFQSNGNRLRRWINGSQIDMQQINVEFKSNCLLGVRVKKTSDQKWRVYSFALHAG